MEQFRRELRQGGRIDMRNLRAFAFHGIPDGGGLRAIAWKVLICSTHIALNHARDALRCLLFLASDTVDALPLRMLR